MIQIHNGWAVEGRMRVVCPGCKEVFYLKALPTCEDGRMAVAYIFCTPLCYTTNRFKYPNVTADPTK